MKAREIPTDPVTGICLAALEMALEQWPVKAIQLTPNCNNPLGYNMPDDRKKSLLRLAQRYDIAIIEDDVSILQNVTLGGTGKHCGDRHPKVRRGVLIGAGAKVLGNIEIGEGAKIGAGSIVLEPVPPFTTVVGNPARKVGVRHKGMPALNMDQTLPPIDYII